MSGSNDFTPVESIPVIFKDVRKTFYSGRSKPLAWRLKQLNGLVRMLEENTERFQDALYKDMGRPK